MKAPSAFLALLLVLAGCSADDLAGPEPDHATASRYAAEAPFNAAGEWAGFDDHGYVTLEIAPAAEPSASRDYVHFGGKATLRDGIGRPVEAKIEGRHERYGFGIELALFDDAGAVVAKADGKFASDRSAVVLEYVDRYDTQRVLKLDRH